MGSQMLRCAQHDTTGFGRSSSLSADGSSMPSPGRYIGGAGMNAPPTQGPVLVVNVHNRVPTHQRCSSPRKLLTPHVGSNGLMLIPVGLCIQVRLGLTRRG